MAHVMRGARRLREDLRDELIPALPLGEHAHHLDWIRGSLVHYDGFLRSIAERAGTWSEKELKEIFDSIVDRCDDDHVCYEPYAPHESLARDGTFYAFDARTRGVREYAAEIALTYFLEHEALFAGTPRSGLPFKCRAPENALAWRRLVDAFFGGVDLTRRCPPVVGHHMVGPL